MIGMKTFTVFKEKNTFNFAENIKLIRKLSYSRRCITLSVPVIHLRPILIINTVQ